MTSDNTALTDALSTAVAIAVAPERADDVVSAIPPERLLAFIWTCEELVRRLNAAKKGAIIEAQVAMSNGELPSVHLDVNGHRYRYQQASSNDFDDNAGLGLDLHAQGVPWGDILRAAGYMKVTELRKAIEGLDEDKRPDAYAVLEERRVKKPGAWSLVDLDSPWRKGKR